MNRTAWMLMLFGGLTAAAVGPIPSAQAQGPAKPPAAAEPDARLIAERVQAFYDTTKTFQAQFDQRYWVKAYNKFKDSKGQVVFEKPGKMSWRYTSNGNRVVSDGKIVKVYEKESRQMFEREMAKSEYPAALAFLMGGAKLTDAFKLRKVDAKALKFEGGYVLEGVPHKATPAYQKVLLFIDAKTYHVRRVMLLDAQGNQNRFTFLDPVANKVVPAAEFQFVPPPGTQVIKG